MKIVLPLLGVLSPINLTLILKICISQGPTGPDREGSAVEIQEFRDFCDTEMIMEWTHMLRNTPYSVGYDLPKEINDARKNLW